MKKNLLIIFLISVFFCACTSKPKFSGNGDLCGLVIDENNSPVKDFVVHCKGAASNPAMGLKPAQTMSTNESGIFVFYDLPSGDYQLYGEKKNYQRILKTSYRFSNRSNIICLQTKGFKASVLNAEKLYSLGQTEAAQEVLENIYCETKSSEELYVNAYLYLMTEDVAKKKEILKKIKSKTAGLKESDTSVFFNQFIAKLEEENL